MIKPITYEDLIKILRTTIITQAELASDKVLNALSIRGTDLSHIISSTQVYSFAAKDTVILFELLKDQDGDNFVTPKDDNHMLVISSYDFHLKVYGNGSDACTQKLRAIFKQPSIALDLREQGIFVKTITSGESINEFINNTMLLRNDLYIKVEVTYLIENTKQQEYFNQNLDIEDVEVIIHEVDEI